ncbi:MAG TPA: 4-hydroxybenzoate octaprenyltransferase [Steroidobacteraceae bacterium]|nr:4-hydroxybenzoate octaprenyltransferase [Steroidobacteraceae bacterium]
MANQSLDLDLAPPPSGGARLAALRYRRRLRDLIEVARLHRPIGIWLLLWPVLWAVWIAGASHPSPKVLVIFVLGTVAMRSAGCVINDLADRNFDPFVKRTRDRPIASRRLAPAEALAWFLVLIASALALVLQLDEKTIRMSLIGAALAMSYPFFKRFFPLPQFYLGVAFSWGVPMVFMAQMGQIPRVAWIIFFAGIIWAAIYDTMYAMVDRDDDLKIGVKSSAIVFGDMDKVIIGFLQLLMLYTLYLVGTNMEFGYWYNMGLAGAAVFFAWQQWLIRDRKPAESFKGFLNNHYVGLSVFIGILLEYAFRPGELSLGTLAQ